MAWSGFNYLFDIYGSQQVAVALPVTTAATIAANNLVENASGKIRKIAAQAPTNVVGVAVEGITNAAAGAKLQVITSPGAVFRVPFLKTGSKTSFTDADLGTAYDVDGTGLNALNPDDTTGGVLILIGYNNAAGTADVLIKGRAPYNN